MRGPSQSAKGEALIGSPVLAESRTPLFTNRSPAEARLTAGKVQNLRQACRKIDGVEIPAGNIFSFWSQIGKPTRRKGFVAGRELRQGCLIPSIGGGLCQLSNALYQCAIESGLEIIERHAHTRVIPGSASAAGRDATVFWNYVDLRFRSRLAFRIEASLTADSLVVRFKGTYKNVTVRGQAADYGNLIKFRTPDPSSCETCGVQSCFRNMQKQTGTAAFGRTAFLVDQFWPEFDQYIQSHKTADDVLGLPINGRRWRKANYAWETKGFKKAGSSPVTALKRSRALRSLPPQGAARQQVLLKYDRAMAESLASTLTFDVRHVVVSQNLLPFLWIEGHLGGRTFDVLMTRLPMDVLQTRLDRVHSIHPQSKTLSDFRADTQLVAAEREALAAARQLITPHSEIARLFPGKVVLLDWHIPSTHRKPPAGDRIMFPASALGRKGAYEMREAARLLGLQITVMGRELEGYGFWQGVAVKSDAGNWLDGVGVVVLPAYVEDQPRRLLEAVAAGVPVIASEACGLHGIEGVTTIPAIEPGLLAEAILVAMQPEGCYGWSGGR